MANVIKPEEKKIGAQTIVQAPQNVIRGVPVAAADYGIDHYTVKERSFINGTIVNPGDIVQLPEGVQPGKKLVRVGKKAAAAPDQIERAVQKRQEMTVKSVARTAPPEPKEEPDGDPL